MTYIKTVWVDGEEPAINETNLNKIEAGIEDAHDLADKKPFCCTDDTGNQSLTGGPVTINLQNVKVSNANYSLASYEITITAAGIYLCSYSLVYDITNTSGGTRGRTIGYVESDDGGSYATLAGSHAGVYHREGAGGSGFSNAFVFEHSNGSKKIRLQANVDHSNTNIDTVAAKVQLTLMKVG